jgi:WD40 repeat protein
MPNNGKRLTDAQVKLVANWISQGAKYDGSNPAASLREQIPRDLPHPAAPEVYAASLPITAVAFTPDGKQVLASGYHELLQFDAISGSRVARIGNFAERTFGMAFSPEGKWLAVAGGAPGASGEVRLIPWSDGVKPEATARVLATQDDVFFKVAFRPDGKQLAASGVDGTIRLFDVSSGNEQLKIAGHSNWIVDVCYSPDGKLIATASRDGTSKVFEVETGKLIATHAEHNVPVNAVVFAPDGKLVITAGANKIHVWNALDGKLIGEIAGFEKDIYALAIAGDSVIGAAADQTVRQFKLADRSLVRALSPNPAWAVSLAVQPATHRVLAGCYDGSVVVWDFEKGSIVKQFTAIPLTPQGIK